MRRILVDHARERQAAKRPGGIRVTFDEALPAVPPPDCEVVMLDDALRNLARLDPRQAEIVELQVLRRSVGGGDRRRVVAVARHGHPRVAVGTSVALSPYYEGPNTRS